MKFIFWANIYSPHVLPMVRRLAAQGHDVTMVAERVMSSQRIAMGWAEPDLGEIRGIVGPDSQAIRELVLDAPDDCIHIIAGVRFRRFGREAIKAVLARKARLGILSESADPRGSFGKLRRLKYAYERFTLGRSFDFILAMGDTGVAWFRRSGYPSERIFQYGYTVDSVPLVAQVASPDESTGYRLLYVGQLISRKGVDTLLNACATVDSDFRLDLIGSGCEEGNLKLLSETLGISQKCFWHGSIPSNQVRKAMSVADALVLPSHHDGWGAVVNEALMMGLPVICSKECGASCLIKRESMGAVFDAGNTAELASIVNLKMKVSAVEKARQRESVLQWSTLLSGESMANYFIDLMEHIYANGSRPSTPWGQAENHSG